MTTEEDLESEDLLKEEDAPKPKFPAREAARVAVEIRERLEPHVLRMTCAGSLRRLKPLVGDVEILFVPRIVSEKNPADLFSNHDVNKAELAIRAMLNDGTLDCRESKTGKPAYGPKNKLLVHVASGIPVDLFTATETSWYNYLVCRTGPLESNIAICCAARRKGWKWRPYGDGFSRGGALAGELEWYYTKSEADVFRFVGLPFFPPEKRK